MGKFDKSRLSGLKSVVGVTVSAAGKPASTPVIGDLRLKLLNKNQVLDARQILNKKKQQQLFTKKAAELTVNADEPPVKAGSLLIMKTFDDQDNNSGKRLYKLVTNYSDLNTKKHIVFANDNSTLVTLNNDSAVAPEQQPTKLTKTIRNYLSLQNDDDEEDEEARRLVNVLRTREINTNQNFKIKIVNSNTRQQKSVEDEMSMDVDEVATTPAPKETFAQSPIQGYRVLVTNLHQNVTEDDILELFSAVGPIKRAKLLCKGTADVVYVKLEDARKAINDYHNRLLDGRELKIELLTKIPIAEKLTPAPAPLQPQPMFTSSYQINRKPQQAAPVLALPQRNRPVAATTTTTAVPAMTNSSTGALSQRFANLQPAAAVTPTAEQIKALPKPANSKVSVDTTAIHQALFTSSATVKSNLNPVTFTVKI